MEQVVSPAPREQEAPAAQPIASLDLVAPFMPPVEPEPGPLAIAPTPLATTIPPEEPGAAALLPESSLDEVPPSAVPTVHLGPIARFDDALYRDVAEEKTRPPMWRLPRTECHGCGDPLSDAARCEHCGTSLRAGGYTILRTISQGPHGRVYEAYSQHGERVALKELSFVLAPDAQTLDAFEREAEFLRKLSHPQIPRFVEAFREGRGVNLRLYIAQQYVAGETMTELAAQEPFSNEDTRRVAKQVLQVLQVLHASDPPVLHRDLKPSNLILGPDGMVWVVDFGAARLLPRGETHGSTLVGTFGYMPPEQLGGTVDESSDLYALGATLMHLLTGRPPEEMTRDGLKLEVDRHLAHVDPQLRTVIKRLVAPNRAVRFRSAGQALRALAPRTHWAKPFAQGFIAALGAIGLGALLVGALQASLANHLPKAAYPTPTFADLRQRLWDPQRIPDSEWLREQIAAGRMPKREQVETERPAPAEAPSPESTAFFRALGPWELAEWEADSEGDRTVLIQDRLAWEERQDSVARLDNMHPSFLVLLPGRDVFGEGNGGLLLHTEPGTEVAIDGVPLPSEEVELDAWPRTVTAGAHQIRLSSKGRTRRLSVVVPEDRLVAALVMPSDYGHGMLAMSSNPSGAEVWIDGRPTGRVTPVPIAAAIRLSEGAHVVEFRLEGLRALWRVDAKNGELFTLRNIELK